MVVEPCIHKCEAGERVGGQKEGVGCQKPETELWWLSFKPAMLNEGGGCWWMLVGLVLRGNGSCGLCIHKHEQERGVGGKKPKIEHDGSVLGHIRALIDAGGFHEVKDPLLL